MAPEAKDGQGRRYFRALNVDVYRVAYPVAYGCHLAPHPGTHLCLLRNETLYSPGQVRH